MKKFNKNLKANFAILSLVAIVAVIGVVGLMFATSSFNDNSNNLGGQASTILKPVAIKPHPIPILPVDNDCGVCCCVDIPLGHSTYTSSGLFVYSSSNDANLLKQCTGLEASLDGLATSHFMIETSSEENCKSLCAVNYMVADGVYQNENGLTLDLEDGIFKNPKDCPEKPQTPVDEPCPEKECCFFVTPRTNVLTDGSNSGKCGTNGEPFFIMTYFGDKSCQELAVQYSGSSQIPSLVGTDDFVLDECDGCLSCCCEPNNNFYESDSQRDCNSHDGIFVSMDTTETCKDVCSSSSVAHLNTGVYIQDGCEETTTTTDDKPMTCCYKVDKEAHLVTPVPGTCNLAEDPSYVIVNYYPGPIKSDCSVLGDYLFDNYYSTLLNNLGHTVPINP